MINTIPRIEGELARGSGAAQKLLAVTALDDAVAVDARARLQAVVEKNFELTNLMVKAYSPYAWLLSAQTDRKIDDFNSRAQRDRGHRRDRYDEQGRTGPREALLPTSA